MLTQPRWTTPSAGLVAAAALAACWLAGPPQAEAQDRFAGVQVEAQHVAGSVYMLTGSGGNIGATVGGDGTLIVDDQYAPLSDEIMATLEKIGQGNVQYVLNTHCHGDHTGGNPVFGETAPIIAHHNVRRRLADAQIPCGGDSAQMDPSGLPVVTFSDSVSVHFNDERIRVLHYPHAHTDGDAAVYFEGSNVLHAGDLYFAGQFPFVDLNTGGSVQGMIDAVRDLIERMPEDVRVIPGHGSVSGLDGLREYHRMLTETAAFVRKRMETGASLEEIQAEGLPAEWKGWASDFIPEDRWIRTIYDSYSG
ncbi:MAG: MBL fold metallo-hydrolase [Gemmatimonadota bacterium]